MTSEVKRIPALPPPPDREGSNASARRKLREKRMGLEMVASSSLLANNSHHEWQDEDGPRQWEDPEGEPPALTLTPKDAGDVHDNAVPKEQRPGRSLSRLTLLISSRAGPRDASAERAAAPHRSEDEGKDEPGDAADRGPAGVGDDGPARPAAEERRHGRPPRGQALPKIRRLMASQRDTPSRAAAAPGGSETAPATAPAVVSKQTRLQEQSRDRPAEGTRDGDLPVPQCQCDDRRSESPPRPRPSEDEIFGDLHESYDETPADPEECDDAAAVVAAAALLHQDSDRDAQDFLKTRGLESVRATRSNRVRNFFSVSGRRGVKHARRSRGPARDGSGEDEGSAGTSSNPPKEPAKDQSRQEEDGKTPASSNRTVDADPGGTASRKGVAGFLRGRNFKSGRDAGVKSGLAAAVVSAASSTTGATSVATKNSAEPVVDERPVLATDRSSLRFQWTEGASAGGPPQPIPEEGAGEEDTASPSPRVTKKLPSPAVVRDRRTKLIVSERVQSQREDERQRQVRRDQRLQKQELERQRAEVERAESRDREGTSAAATSPGTPGAAPPYPMATPPPGQRSSVTPSTPIPDPTIRDYLWQPTVSSSVIHGPQGPGHGGCPPLSPLPATKGLPSPGDGRDGPLAATPGSSSAASKLTPGGAPLKRGLSHDSPTGVEEVMTSAPFHNEEGRCSGSAATSVASGGSNAVADGTHGKEKKEGKDTSPSKSVKSWYSDDTEVTNNTTDRNASIASMDRGWNRRRDRDSANPEVASQSPEKGSVEIRYQEIGSGGPKFLDGEEMSEMTSDYVCLDNFGWLVQCWKSPTASAKRSSEEVLQEEDESADAVRGPDGAVGVDERASPSRSLFGNSRETREIAEVSAVAARDAKEEPVALGPNESSTSKVELELDDGRRSLKILPNSRPKTCGGAEQMSPAGGESASSEQEEGTAAGPAPATELFLHGGVSTTLSSYSTLSPQAQMLLQEHIMSSPSLLDNYDESAGGKVEELAPPDIKRDIHLGILFDGSNKDRKEENQITDEEDVGLSHTGEVRIVEAQKEGNNLVEGKANNFGIIVGSPSDASTLDKTLNTHHTLDSVNSEKSDDNGVGGGNAPKESGCHNMIDDISPLSDIKTVIPKWMGLNGVLQVVDKIDDACNGELCKEELASVGSDSDDDTIEDVDLNHHRSKNSRRYRMMREQRERRKRRLEKARKHRDNRHRSSAAEMDHRVRLSPVTIVSEESDNKTDGYDGARSTMDGTQTTCSRPYTPDTLWSATPSTLTCSTRSFSVASSTNVIKTVDSIADEDLDKHIKIALHRVHKENKLNQTVAESPVAESPYRQNLGDSQWPTRLDAPGLANADAAASPRCPATPKEGAEGGESKTKGGGGRSKDSGTRMGRISRTIQNKGRIFGGVIKRGDKHRAAENVAEGEAEQDWF